MGNDLQLPKNLEFQFETEEETLKRLIFPKVVESKYFKSKNQNDGEIEDLFTLDDFKSRKKKKMENPNPIFIPKYYLEFNQELQNVPEIFNLIPKCPKNVSHKVQIASIIPKKKNLTNVPLAPKMSAKLSPRSDEFQYESRSKFFFNNLETSSNSCQWSENVSEIENSSFFLEDFDCSFEKDDIGSSGAPNSFLEDSATCLAMKFSPFFSEDFCSIEQKEENCFKDPNSFPEASANREDIKGKEKMEEASSSMYFAGSYSNTDLGKTSDKSLKLPSSESSFPKAYFSSSIENEGGNSSGPKKLSLKKVGISETLQCSQFLPVDISTNIEKNGDNSSAALDSFLETFASQESHKKLGPSVCSPFFSEEFSASIEKEKNNSSGARNLFPETSANRESSVYFKDSSSKTVNRKGVDWTGFDKTTKWTTTSSSNLKCKDARKDEVCSQYFQNSSPKMDVDDCRAEEFQTVSLGDPREQELEEIKCSQYFSQENAAENLVKHTEISTGSLLSKLKKNLSSIQPISSCSKEFLLKPQNPSHKIEKQLENSNGTGNQIKIQSDFNLDNISVSCSQYFDDEPIPKVEKQICNPDEIPKLTSRNFPTQEEKPKSVETFTEEASPEVQKNGNVVPQTFFSTGSLFSPENTANTYEVLRSQYFSEETPGTNIESENSPPTKGPTKSFSRSTSPFSPMKSPKTSPRRENKFSPTPKIPQTSSDSTPTAKTSDEDEKIICSQYFSQEHNFPEVNETTSILSKLRKRILQSCSPENLERVPINRYSERTESSRPLEDNSKLKNSAVLQMEVFEYQKNLVPNRSPEEISEENSNFIAKGAEKLVPNAGIQKILDEDNIQRIIDEDRSLFMEVPEVSGSSKRKTGTPLSGKKKRLIGKRSTRSSNNDVSKKKPEGIQKKLRKKTSKVEKDPQKLLETTLPYGDTSEDSEDLQFTKEFLPHKLHKFYNPIKPRRRIRLKPSDSPRIPPGGLKPLWTPPKSPHGLIEEDYVSNPWGLLVATIFLNKTSGRVAKPYIDDFLKNYPTPESVVSKKPEDFESYFEELGLKKRSEQIWKMSKDFLEKNWRNARELHGIGKYGDDAFRLFCIGDLEVEPEDRYLKIYHRWVTKDRSLDKREMEVVSTVETP